MTAVSEDPEIPGGDIDSVEKLKSVPFSNLEAIAEQAAQTSINFIGIVHKVGPIGNINLKTGENKYRRNIVVCDETN